MTSNAHIIVALSGGVDSSVSAYLLKKAGYSIEAIFMKNWEDEECPATEDIQVAQTVCEQLKIDFHVVNFANEYWEGVFAYFLDEYRAGRTPNPDILCNKEIKFKAFLDYAKKRGADYIATGHYVRSQREGSAQQLLKGLDPQKDQSYFLHALTAAQLSQSIFPVGNIEKTAVRALATEIKLPNHARKDSTGICFIGERKFKQFLNEYLPAQPGVIETVDGDKVGRHEGLMFYTIGQRQGLCIGGMKGRSELPWYVVAKDMDRNVLVVAQGEHDRLYKTCLIAKDVHWINSSPLFPASLKAKTRYRQPDQPCTIDVLNNERYRVSFAVPQRAITPGQSVVFYHNDICLGGGIIES